jgi:hypothetical protein
VGGARTTGLLAALAVACNGISGIGELATASAELDAGSPADVAAAPPDREDPADADADAGAPADAAPEALPRDGGRDAAPCVATSAGPRYAAAISGGEMWTGRQGIRTPNDGLFAHTNGDNTTTLTVNDYRFAVPDGARIVGIEVALARTADGVVTDDRIQLPKGDARANGAWPPGPGEGPYVTTTYGGPTDTWGATWTPADVNRASFGVSVSVKGAGDGHADSLGVTIHYCEAVTP